MTDRHLDDGLIQAYIDGELSREHAASTAAHLAACEMCSAALAEGQDESSFFATAFAPDDSLSVPTAALRARLNAAVAQLETSSESEQRHSQVRRSGGLLASFAGLFNFTPRTAVAFATLLVAVAAGIIYISSQKSQPSPGMTTQVVQNIQNVQIDIKPIEPILTKKEIVEALAVAPEVKGDSKSPYAQAKHIQRVIRKQPVAPSTKEEALPGEKAYQTAIASLEKTIKQGGDESLRPAVRADYERNLALIDSAIAQTRQVAARNPKDKDAVGFLMSVYQSKVELLARVADQAQVATLGR